MIISVLHSPAKTSLASLEKSCGCNPNPKIGGPEPGSCGISSSCLVGVEMFHSLKQEELEVIQDDRSSSDLSIDVVLL
jgi:hypothetical protein